MPSTFPFKLPKSSDKLIDMSLWQNLMLYVKKATNIVFDKSKFSVTENDMGTFVTIQPQILSTQSTSTLKEIFDLRQSSIQKAANTSDSQSTAIINPDNANALSNCSTVVIESYDVAKDNGVYLLGVKSEVQDGSHIQYDSNASAWVSEPINDLTKWVYLELDRANVVSTIQCESSLPNGTDSLEIVPLWSIIAKGEDETHTNGTSTVYTIDFNECVDMRTTVRLPGMS